MHTSQLEQILDETDANPHYHQDLRQSHSLSEREAAWLGKRPYLHFEAGAALLTGRFMMRRPYVERKAPLT